MCLFRNVLTYLAHQVLKDGVCSSNSNLEAIAESTPPQTYTEVWAFLGLVGHYRRFIKGSACITQPQWVSHWGRGQQEVREGVTHKGCHGSFQSIETGLLDSSHIGVCWLHQTIPAGDQYIQILIRGSVVTKAGRQVVPPPLPMAAEPWGHIRRAITQPNLNFWHSNGQLQITLKTIYPTSHLWCGWIIIHLCT